MCGGESLRMLPPQGENAPAYVASIGNRCLCAAPGAHGHWCRRQRAWGLQEAVVAYALGLGHLPQERFTFAGTLFALACGLFPRLGITELLLEQRDHVKVDVKRVNFGRQVVSNGLHVLTSHLV